MAIGNMALLYKGSEMWKKIAGLYMRMSSCETELILAVPSQLHGLDPF